jgi:hypothetical protein
LTKEKPKKKRKLADRALLIFFVFAGAALVVSGCFMTAVDGAYESSYFDYAGNEKFALFVCSTLIVLTGISGAYWFLRLLVPVAITCPFWPLISPIFYPLTFWERFGEALSSPLYQVVLNMSEFQWGGIVLFSGLFCFLGAFFVSFRRKTEVKAPVGGKNP